MRFYTFQSSDNSKCFFFWNSEIHVIWTAESFCSWKRFSPLKVKWMQIKMSQQLEMLDLDLWECFCQIFISKIIILFQWRSLIVFHLLLKVCRQAMRFCALPLHRWNWSHLKRNGWFSLTPNHTFLRQSMTSVVIGGLFNSLEQINMLWAYNTFPNDQEDLNLK